MAITPQQKEIIAHYVATFNAAPGAEKLQELTKKIEAGMSPQQLTEDFVKTNEFKTGILNGAVTNEDIAKKLAGNFSLTADNPDAQLVDYFNALLTQGASISDVINAAVVYLRGPHDEKFNAIADVFQKKVADAEASSQNTSALTANTPDQLQAVLKDVIPNSPKTEAEAETFLKGQAAIKTQDVVDIGDVIDNANIIQGYNDQAELIGDGAADMGITLTGVTVEPFGTTSFNFA